MIIYYYAEAELNTKYTVRANHIMSKHILITTAKTYKTSKKDCDN